MTIYDLNNKQIREYIMKFAKTTYGKIVFINSYIPSFFVLVFLVGVLLFSVHFKYNMTLYSASLLGVIVLALIFITTFLKGNRYYYNELKDYIEKPNK